LTRVQTSQSAPRRKSRAAAHVFYTQRESAAFDNQRPINTNLVLAHKAPEILSSDADDESIDLIIQLFNPLLCLHTPSEILFMDVNNIAPKKFASQWKAQKFIISVKSTKSEDTKGKNQNTDETEIEEKKTRGG